MRAFFASLFMIWDVVRVSSLLLVICIQMRAFVHMRACWLACEWVDVHVRVHAVHAFMQALIRARVACVCVAYARACSRACVRVRMRPCVRVCVHAFFSGLFLPCAVVGGALPFLLFCVQMCCVHSHVRTCMRACVLLAHARMP